MSQQLLSRARFLEHRGLAIHEEPIPEIPDEEGKPSMIRMRQLSARESMELTKRMEGPDGGDGMFWILIYSCIDENGDRVFAPEDLDAMRDLNFSVLNRLQRVALRLNKMGPEAETETKNG